MDPQTEFMNAVNALMETLWPAYSPHEIVKFNDNLANADKYTALVMVWHGTVSNAIVKKCFKVWKNGGTLQYAEIAKSDWPVGI